MTFSRPVAGLAVVVEARRVERARRRRQQMVGAAAQGLEGRRLEAAQVARAQVVADDGGLVVVAVGAAHGPDGPAELADLADAPGEAGAVAQERRVEGRAALDRDDGGERRA